MTITVHARRCFGAHAGAGNPALVVEHDASDANARQNFARGQSTCVFIDSDASGAIVLDYFYPHQRSPLCLHATLAAAHVLFERARSDAPIDVITALRGQRLTLLKSAGGYFIRLARQTTPLVDIAAGLPAALLNHYQKTLSPPAIVSIGSPKLLLEVKDSATLHALRPNLELIADWNAANGVNGCYAYCKLSDGRYEGRNFNHLDAALEDSATGVAAGALSLHLQRDLLVLQGHMTGQACLIRTRIDGDDVLVGGAVQAGAVQAGAVQTGAVQAGAMSFGDQETTLIDH